MTKPLATITSSGLDAKLIAYINVKLALLGFAPVATGSDQEFSEIASALIARYREEERLLSNYLCPSDQRIQAFLHDYFQDHSIAVLPNRTFVLDRPGLARVLSLPVDRNELATDIIHSYRIKQGVLHNPKKRPPHYPGHFPCRRRRSARAGRQAAGAQRCVCPAL